MKTNIFHSLGLAALFGAGCATTVPRTPEEKAAGDARLLQAGANNIAGIYGGYLGGLWTIIGALAGEEARSAEKEAIQRAQTPTPVPTAPVVPVPAYLSPSHSYVAPAQKDAFFEITSSYLDALQPSRTLRTTWGLFDNFLVSLVPRSTGITNVSFVTSHDADPNIKRREDYTITLGTTEVIKVFDTLRGTHKPGTYRLGIHTNVTDVPNIENLYKAFFFDIKLAQ